jgi:hypothetical protein
MRPNTEVLLLLALAASVWVWLVMPVVRIVFLE